jgi:hypothetical protein
MKKLLLCLLCIAALCLFACTDPTVDAPPPIEDPTPDAASLLLDMRAQVARAGGRYTAQTEATMQTDLSYVHVSLYAAVRGTDVYQRANFSTDGQELISSHAYKDGVLRAGGSVLTLPVSEYRAAFGFPSAPDILVSKLTSTTVSRELDGYCFSLRLNAAQYAEFLHGVLGRDLYALFSQGTVNDLLFTFHFDKNGSFHTLNIRADMSLNGQAAYFSAVVAYDDWGTATLP